MLHSSFGLQPSRCAPQPHFILGWTTEGLVLFGRKICFDARPHLNPLPRGEDFTHHAFRSAIDRRANWRGRGRAGRADFYASFIILPSAFSMRSPNPFHFEMDDRGFVAFEFHF
jgi:hypothetical protein